MSEQPTDASQEPLSEEANKPQNGIDPFLAALVIFASSGGIEPDITLNLGGSLLSGTLISGKRYFEKLSDLLSIATVSGTAGEEARSFLLQSLEDWKAIYNQFDTLTQDPPPLPSFIHLGDARWLHPTGVIPADAGVLWRGKLSAVDGFCFGRTGPSTPT